jgi:hypothetical protein
LLMTPSCSRLIAGSFSWAVHDTTIHCGPPWVEGSTAFSSSSPNPCSANVGSVK